MLGSYESELQDVVNKIIATNYSVVVDVGSAEGFYAVGLAMKMPAATKVYAFDINIDAQDLCRALAARNNVGEKVTVSGFCDTDVLQKTLKGRSLLICDCEGYETELLQPTQAPVLKEADILVELHDFIKPGVTPEIMSRFKDSHDILVIDSEERNPADYPSLSFLPVEQQKIAISEFRHGKQQWAFMTPKELYV